MDPLIRFAMCALMPRVDGVPGIADTGVEEFVARFRRESTLPIWLGVFLGAVFFVLLPLFTVGVPLPAPLLSARLLERHAQKMSVFPLYLVRQPIFLLKMLAGMCWGAHPSVRAYLHLPRYGEDPGTWRAS